MARADNIMDTLNVVCMCNCGEPEYNVQILRRHADGRAYVGVGINPCVETQADCKRSYDVTNLLLE